MVHTLKILCILIKKQKYKTTRYKQQHNQKLPIYGVGGRETCLLTKSALKF